MSMQVADFLGLVLAVASFSASALLRGALKETLDLAAVIDRRTRGGAAIETRHAPEFALERLDGMVVNRRDVLPPPGEMSALVFISPAAFALDAYRIPFVLKRIYADTPGRIHVVCTDSRDCCAEFLQTIG